jgi:serine/threonine protein kinase
MVYEMLCGGWPPFDELSTDMAIDAILNGPIAYLESMPTVTQDFLRALLNRDPTQRLGAGPGGLERVMAHPFLSGLDWEDVRRKKTVPKWVPTICHPDDPEFGWAFDQHDSGDESSSSVWSCDRNQ